MWPAKFSKKINLMLTSTLCEFRSYLWFMLLLEITKKPDVLVAPYCPNLSDLKASEVQKLLVKALSKSAGEDLRRLNEAEC